MAGERARPIDQLPTCPDPSLHDEDAQELEDLLAQIERLADWIVTNVPGEPSQSEGAVPTTFRIMADLRTELLKTHADLEASRAREQIAQGQRDAVLAVLDRAPFAYDDLDAIRAIYAEHGDGHGDG
jgi:hypothetical protein